MSTPPADPLITLNARALGQLMPMHASLGEDCTILTAGTTLERIANRRLVGLAFDEIFALRRPASLRGARDLARLAGQPLQIALLGEDTLLLRGLVVPASGGGRAPEPVAGHQSRRDGEAAPP